VVLDEPGPELGRSSEESCLHPTQLVAALK
jgi:hypothetical protein